MVGIEERGQLVQSFQTIADPNESAEVAYKLEQESNIDLDDSSGLPRTGCARDIASCRMGDDMADK